ncbi:MAG: isoprenylcysteine carboxylmethyltransferase family protein [Desulfovibrionaceae bacterium]|nr:isoprenylcysteine carboxylmethyltransferase family protein [Desulfovibrionaceae bacterium]
MNAAMPSASPFPDSPGVRIMPPLVFLLNLLAGVILHWAAPWPVPGLPQTVGLAAGLLLAGAGIAFMMWGHTLFTRLGVNVKTIRPASMLVATGAYAWSRNPMYVGFLAILAGLGLAAGSAWMVLTVLPMAFYLGLYVIPREEAYLARRFGVEYETYRRAVRRWL